MVLLGGGPRPSSGPRDASSPSACRSVSSCLSAVVPLVPVFPFKDVPVPGDLVGFWRTPLRWRRRGDSELDSVEAYRPDSNLQRAFSRRSSNVCSVQAIMWRRALAKHRLQRWRFLVSTLAAVLEEAKGELQVR